MNVLASAIRSTLMACIFAALSSQAMQWKVSRKHRTLAKAYTLINHDRGYELQQLLESEQTLSSEIANLLIYAIHQGSIESVLLFIWPDTFRDQTIEKIRAIVQANSISKLHQRIWQLACQYLCRLTNQNQKKQFIYALQNARIDINARDIMGQTLLHSQIGFLLIKMPCYAEFLLEEARANPNVRNNDGETALHEAVRTNRKAFIRLVIHHGAKINQPNYNGATALTIAAAEGSEDVVELLLENGAIVSRLDITNARIHGHRKLAQRLEIWRETHKTTLVSYVRSKLATHISADDTQTREHTVAATVQACVEKMVQAIEGHHRLKAVIPEIARSCRYPDNRLAAGLEEWSVKQETDLLTHITERLGLDIAPTKRKLLAQQKVTPMRASLDTLIETVQKNDPLLQREIPMVLTWQAQCQRASQRI